MTVRTLLLIPMFWASIAVAQEQQPKSLPLRTISVRGAGTVNAVPDQVRLTVHVNTRAESPSSAMGLASSKTRDVLAVLKEYDVETKDIQTSLVTVNPILDYQQQLQPPPIVGYTGMNQFAVVFRGKKMSAVGAFMDKAAALGASNFGALTYEASNQRTLEREALRKAADDARDRAHALAEQLRVTLGHVVSITESVSSPAPIIQEGRVAQMAMAEEPAPVMTGELTISARVDVVFELK